MAKAEPKLSLSEDDAIKAVSAYQEKLQALATSSESKFDNAVLLVAGGAFTVSAAFIGQMQGKLTSPVWLAVAWIGWGVCLVVCIGGHMLSAYANQRVIRLIDAGDYDSRKYGTGPAKVIPYVNWASYVLLVTGLIAYGIFSFNNLQFGGSNGQEEGKEKSSQTVRPQQPLGGNISNAGAGMAAATKEEVRQNDKGKTTVTADSAKGTIQALPGRSAGQPKPSATQ